MVKLELGAWKHWINAWLISIEKVCDPTSRQFLRTYEKNLVTHQHSVCYDFIDGTDFGERRHVNGQAIGIAT
jgi:hypothetical protein